MWFFCVKNHQKESKKTKEGSWAEFSSKGFKVISFIKKSETFFAFLEDIHPSSKFWWILRNKFWVSKSHCADEIEAEKKKLKNSKKLLMHLLKVCQHKNQFP